MRYALPRWSTLLVFVEDGRVENDNNLVENSIRPAARGRKNWLFIGAEEAGWQCAVMYSIIHSCHLQGVDTYEYILDLLNRLPGMKASDLPQVTPHAWAKSRRTRRKPAA